MHQFFRISSLIISVSVLILWLGMLIYTKFTTPSSLLPVVKIKKHSGNWHLNLTPPEKLSFLSPYREIWINEKNNCSCNIGAPLPLTKSYDQKDMLAIEKRRKIQFEQHRKRNESPLKNIIIAQPNSPLSYPTHGVEVMPLQSIVIPVSFQFEEHVAEFPIIIRQPPMPRLFDPGPDNDINSLVTITTKTFLRYHKLRVLIDSIRRFYPNMTIIIADDSEVPEKIEGPHIEQYFMPFAKGWFAGRNLAASQVTTKYLLWVDEDFLFTKATKVEKLVEVLENTDLDVVGASVNGNRFQFKLWYEKGNDDDGDCLFSKPGSFYALNGFPNCHLTSVVVNFFLAKTSKILSVGFDPQLARVAHPEFFIDGLGRLLVGSCSDVIISHQTTMSPSNNTLKAIEQKYAKYRRRAQWETDLKHRLHYFKNHLKCYSKI
ncbi:beta-1,4 N-acetylgalactosaminyltransferase 2-like isoform X2 [Stegostoma tigrinum]|uniref:beta-1,4 N-acetylgalactosaminyltransferase 2-like isoform X2 n=1 Tax=Stegostoma tigrinum TaxID=3053191 RepID=UPI00202B177E|nr:beta-1,4 N-acetylgalactosaminyltransferase 2-like isoform X2 [Stegostoma tigrinum]